MIKEFKTFALSRTQFFCFEKSRNLAEMIKEIKIDLKKKNL